VKNYRDEQFPLPLPGRLKRELNLPRPPIWLMLAAVAVLVPAGVVFALIYRARTTTSTRPRIQLVQDMGVQPRYGPQAASPVFADGRSARLPVPGTIARGTILDDPLFSDGYVTASDPANAQPTLSYCVALPAQVAQMPNLLERGQMQFNIYCAVCHGRLADGHGLVNETAVRNKEPKWVPAPSLLTPAIAQQAPGQIYTTIKNGIRNMPAYAVQIAPADRWAIVAYVRHLQQSAPAPATSPTISTAAASPTTPMEKTQP
jgi:mono/diheme cytochrome c family protein